MDEKVREIEKRLQNRYSEVPDRFLWPLMDIQYLLSHIEKLEGRVKELGNMVALAAREINCSGPLVERIRVLKQEFQRNLEVATERAEKAEARNKELREGIEKHRDTIKEFWAGRVEGKDIDMIDEELYKLIEGD